MTNKIAPSSHRIESINQLSSFFPTPPCRLRRGEFRPELGSFGFGDGAGLAVFREQLAFGAGPIVEFASRGAGTFEVDLVGAEFDFLTCRMSLGSLRSAACG